MEKSSASPKEGITIPPTWYCGITIKGVASGTTGIPTGEGDEMGVL